MHLLIDSSAKVEIVKKIEFSGLPNPVATLCDVADAGDYFKKTKSEYVQGLDLEELAIVSKNEFFQNCENLVYKLEVSIFDCKDCRSTDLVEINEVMFAISPHIFEKLNNYRLMFIDNSFLLEGNDDIVLNLQTIAVN